MYLHWKTFVQSKIYICALQFSFKGHPSLFVKVGSMPQIVNILKSDKLCMEIFGLDQEWKYVQATKASISNQN